MDGLEVYTFRIDEKDLELTPDPSTGLSRVADANIEFKVEPRSGATIDTVSITSVSLLHPQAGKTPMFVSSIRFTDENVAESTSDGKSARSKLITFGICLPWTILIVGIVVFVAGISLYGFFCWRRMKAKEAVGG